MKAAEVVIALLESNADDFDPHDYLRRELTLDDGLFFSELRAKGFKPVDRTMGNYTMWFKEYPRVVKGLWRFELELEMMTEGEVKFWISLEQESGNERVVLSRTPEVRALQYYLREFDDWLSEHGSISGSRNVLVAGDKIINHARNSYGS